MRTKHLKILLLTLNCTLRERNQRFKEHATIYMPSAVPKQYFSCHVSEVIAVAILVLALVVVTVAITFKCSKIEI